MKKILVLILVLFSVEFCAAQDIYGKFSISPESRSIYTEATFYSNGTVTFYGDNTKEFSWKYDKEYNILYIGDFGFYCEIRYESLPDGSVKEVIRLVCAYHEYKTPDVILTKYVKEAE